MKKSLKRTKKDIDEIDNIELLSNAIIIQAVKDYKYFYKALSKNKNNTYAKHELENIEEFFLGDWIKALTSLDGKFILDSVKEILKNDRKFDK